MGSKICRGVAFSGAGSKLWQKPVLRVKHAPTAFGAASSPGYPHLAKLPAHLGGLPDILRFMLHGNAGNPLAISENSCP